jgi:hypothetical protein
MGVLVSPFSMREIAEIASQSFVFLSIPLAAVVALCYAPWLSRLLG